MPSLDQPKLELFTEWSLYRKVVEHDYMRHSAVTRAVERALSHLAHDHSVLDLGCGDAEVISRVSSHGRIARYVGVDQSQAALDAARQRLDGRIEQLEFRRADILGFVETATERFDVILCGYALHHLDTAEKRDFFRHARPLLASGGILLAYDAFHAATESRESFVEAYIQWIAREWSEILPEEHTMIAEHMRAADLPETIEAFCNLARDAGLQPAPEPVWSCDQDFHHMIRISE